MRRRNLICGFGGLMLVWQDYHCSVPSIASASFAIAKSKIGTEIQSRVGVRHNILILPSMGTEVKVTSGSMIQKINFVCIGKKRRTVFLGRDLEYIKLVLQARWAYFMTESFIFMGNSSELKRWIIFHCTPTILFITTHCLLTICSQLIKRVLFTQSTGFAPWIIFHSTPTIHFITTLVHWWFIVKTN